MSKFARLMHLVDSSIPVGSFAYSYGMESAITFGAITTIQGLKNHLYSFLQQIVSMELPFVQACFHLEAPNCNAYLKLLVVEYDAMVLIPTIHKASVAQGKNWCRLLTSLYPQEDIQQMQDWFSEENLPLHFTIAFALCSKRIGFEIQEVTEILLHMALRDQVSAALRLGFIGPMEAHKLQHDFYQVFEHLLENGIKDHKQASRSAFLLDLSQMYHQNIYSKLFQN